MELTHSERDSVAVGSTRPAKTKALKVTHFAWSDSPRSKYFIQAACGAWIRMADESPDPSCFECRQLQRAHDDLKVG